MLKLFKHLDRVLRGEATHPDALAGGQIDVSVRGLTVIIVLLGMLYGVFMGSYSLLKESNPTVQTESILILREPSSNKDGDLDSEKETILGLEKDRVMQLLASMVKVPALFLLTLFVTFPSLYVFNALVGSRISFITLLRLLIISLSVNIAVLASLGFIVAFFSLTTKSYSFVMILNTTVFGIAGVLGLMFLLQTLHRLTHTMIEEQFKEKLAKLKAERAEEAAKLEAEQATQKTDEPETQEESSEEYVTDVEMILPEPEEEPSALDMPEGQMLARHTRFVFGIWVSVFALVGVQMGWVLRPFIGSPDLPFTWFRPRNSNFFEAVWNALNNLLLGG